MNLTALNADVLSVLAQNGGWMSSGAVFNRMAEDVTKDQLNTVLDRLVKTGGILERHSEIGLEYGCLALGAADYRPRPLQALATSVAAQLHSAPTPPPIESPQMPRGTEKMARTRAEDLAAPQTRQRVENLVRLNPRITAKEISEQLSITRYLAKQLLDLVSPPAATPPATVVTPAAVPSPFKPTAALSAAAAPYPTQPKAKPGVTKALVRELLERQPGITGDQVAEQLGIAASTASYHLTNLKRDAAAGASAKTFATADSSPSFACEQAPAAPKTTTRFALWSDGRLAIQRQNDLEETVLEPEETRALVRYLDVVMALPSEVTV